MVEKDTMKVALIIQARMGSTRFPGKSLLPIARQPLLEHIIIRLKQVPHRGDRPAHQKILESVLHADPS